MKKFDCEIAVVGAGVAGLTAAVQAARLGKNVILLESCRRTGGNWDVTYGMMAVDSPLSKKLGIHVNARALVNQEVRLFNYQVDAKMWIDLADASGENVSWLMEQGGGVQPGSGAVYGRRHQRAGVPSLGEGGISFKKNDGDVQVSGRCNTYGNNGRLFKDLRNESLTANDLVLASSGIA